MVKNSIKVYARLRREDLQQKPLQYEIVTKNDYEHITFHLKNKKESSSKKQAYCRFRFHKVFDQVSTQSEVFDTIAKPVVSSVIHGFNGTIFAYGQTGSGKTYAITGSSEEYHERGVIPRSIQHIFELTSKSPEIYSVYISYMEIYNEVGYDLLNPKQQAASLEQLPRVYLLEDGQGESHLRNLSVLPVSNEQEAMRLLFLGDTNRTIAETPMNEYSSRSHCIFTIYLSAKGENCGKTRRSKLNLVDLAGSERIHKSNITGITLNEAKHINLSLHYLEQVILALSQTNRCHIPYRNSMMTYMLRDSLSGNCLTVMLATLAINNRNAEETFSTCKFSQRVALINTEAVINEQTDPVQEIAYLRYEVEDLRKQLLLQKNHTAMENVTHEQIAKCKKLVNEFLTDASDELLVDADMRQIQICFKLLRQAVNDQKSKDMEAKSMEKENIKVVERLKEAIKIKDEEIYTLKTLRDTPKAIVETYQKPLPSHNSPLNFSPPSSLSSTLNYEQYITSEEQNSFKRYTSDPNNTTELDFCTKALAQMYERAKSTALALEKCQKSIIIIRNRLEFERSEVNIEILNNELVSHQKTYRELLLQLQSMKRETDHLKHGMSQAKIKMVHKFKERIETKNNTANNLLRYVFEDTIGSLRSEEATFDTKYFPDSYLKDSSTDLHSSSCLKRQNACDFDNMKNAQLPLESRNVFYDENTHSRAEFFNWKNGCLNNLDKRDKYEKSPLMPREIWEDIENDFTCNRSCSNLQKFNDYTFKNVASSNRFCSNNVQKSGNRNLCISERPYSSNLAESDNYFINNLPVDGNTNTRRSQNNNHGLTSCYNSLSDLSIHTKFENLLKTAESLPAALAQKDLRLKRSYRHVNFENSLPEKPKIHPSNQEIFRDDDSIDFIDFMKTVPLTGDSEVDDEIVNFYRCKFLSTRK